MKTITTPDKISDYIILHNKCRICNSILKVDNVSLLLDEDIFEVENAAWCKNIPEHYIVRFSNVYKNNCYVISEEIDFDYDEHKYYIEIDPSSDKYICMVDGDEDNIIFVNQNHLNFKKFSEGAFAKIIETYRLLK